MVINHLSGMILQVGFHFFISGFCYNRNVQLVDRWHEWEPCRYEVGSWGEKQVGCCTRESWLWLVLDTLQCLLWFWWWWRWWWSWWLHISAIYIYIQLLCLFSLSVVSPCDAKQGKLLAAVPTLTQGWPPSATACQGQIELPPMREAPSKAEKRNLYRFYLVVWCCLGNSLMRALD